MGNNTKWSLTQSDVKENIEKLQAFMKEKDLDFFYLSSADPFLNEYVPLQDCHRYYFSGFSGSTAELLVPQSGKVHLFVDGRYHEAADLEVDLDMIDVVKVKHGESNLGLLQEKLATDSKVGYEAPRTALKFAKILEAKTNATAFSNELESIVSFERITDLPEVYSVEEKVKITTVPEKLDRVYKGRARDEALFLSALDDICWLTNLRGYHLPYMSSFYGRAIVTLEKIYIFVGKDIKIAAGADKHLEIEFIKCDEASLKEEFQKIQFGTILADPNTINAYDYQTLVGAFGKDKVVEKVGGLTPYKSIKDKNELELIRDSFIRASKAIKNTLMWVKDSVKKGEKITELDVFNKTTECYREQGAITQSFQTISGVGPNSSIIHFGAASADVEVKDTDIILLDSGGYFESGFATDTTRAILAGEDGSKADPKLKEIYTLVLKGFINCHNAVVEEGTPGSKLDELAREPIKAGGYDYAHGTGHGVGVYVHEGGINFSPRATELTVKPGQVVSVEPGIYIPGFGGVRHENVVIVQPHPVKQGYVFFEPLTYVGFDHLLIDFSMLTEDENMFFQQYEMMCEKYGTTFS